LFYTANFIGSVLLAAIVANTGLMAAGTPIAESAIKKLHLTVAIPFGAAILRGILCNVLVVLAVWMPQEQKSNIKDIRLLVPDHALCTLRI
jgi:formate/nitrite transporter FocA (FNT family)